MAQIDHIPDGDPCSKCGKPASRHRIDHMPDGDPCSKCNQPSTRHRIRVKRGARARHEDIYLGIDGEGQGRDHHRYVLLAASTEDGKKSWWVDDYNGLSTIDCFEFLLNLPNHATRAFTFSFNYDLTKILKDLPDDKLYMLFRPELRQRFGKEAMKGPVPIRWNGYRINLQGTKFTLAKGKLRIVIWDIFKFFQSKYVVALKDWKVGSKEMLDRMTLMKDKRAEFDKEKPEDVLAYCLEECRYMAELSRKLVDAHTSAGLKLKSFYGAGSSASAMLLKMGVKEAIVDSPPQMKQAIASAFFGGRFENSVIGKVEGTVYSYDISSAYPYQLCFLPCLLHGRWVETTHRKDLDDPSIRTALVQYGLGANPGINDWGPFPFRTSDGSICFPITSGGGYVWRDEYLAGERLFPHVQFKKAWVYRCDCDCKPFERIPEYYCERCRIGKEGPGIVIKLGCNSCYGKLAQSVGRGMFNNWVWAGLITSGCRAQALELLGLHKDRSNMLMIATDGIQTRERFHCDVPDKNHSLTGNETRIKPPRETGTNQTGKPLGGWEEKVIDKGVFYARPGIYFPMNPTKEELKEVRGRGVGKGVVLENWKLIVDTWDKHHGKVAASVANVSRFCGAKSSIHRSGKPGAWVYKRADGMMGPNSPSYGQWVTRSVRLGFDPKPKRASVNHNGRTLDLRDISQEDFANIGGLEMSVPYQKALRSPEAEEMMAAAQELLEQPDSDLADYELTPD